jgi:exodeoxyribonuclease VII small subunit
MPEKPVHTEDQSFEEQLERLEAIVASLEDDAVGLEQALGLFEDGIELAKSCRARLEEVEQRVQQLLETEAGEPAQTTPLESDDEETEASGE